MVPEAGTNVCVVALNEVPFHHFRWRCPRSPLPLDEMVPAEFDDAVPVIVPDQSSRRSRHRWCRSPGS